MNSEFNIKQFYDLKKPRAKKKSFKVKWEDKEFSLDYPLKIRLDILADDLQQNDDALIIIFGSEGAGKSYFGSQIAHYLSTKLKVDFDITKVHFDSQRYMNMSLSSTKFNINFLDESRRALNKMRGSSGNNVDFMNFLSECRSQNQIHIVLLPAFTDLERYVAIHRVKLVLSVEKKRDKNTGKLMRGIYNIWRGDNKAQLNACWEAKYREFPYNMLIHKGRFDNLLCIDKAKYDNKKENSKSERYEKNTKTVIADVNRKFKKAFKE